MAWPQAAVRVESEGVEVLLCGRTLTSAPVSTRKVVPDSSSRIEVRPPMAFN
jgi:hypothetical protein